MSTANTGPFEFQIRTRMVQGRGAIERLGSLARPLVQMPRALLVTDAGLRQAGHVERAQKSLEACGFAVAVYDASPANPTSADVDLCAHAAREINPQLLIGLGGGSSLDLAKGCNFVLTNGGSIEDYCGFGKARQPMLPFIAVPTTSGTGSEMQSYAVIADDKTHRKMACGDSKAAAAIAVLDPELTVSQPFEVAAHSGVDALSHAVESAVTASRTNASWMFAREAFAKLSGSFPCVLAEPSDLAARAEMQWGAAYAGIAIENSMLGAAHACANPLTARFKLTHGMAVGMMLPWVVRFNARTSAAANYVVLARLAGWASPDDSPEHAIEKFALGLQRLLRVARMPEALCHAGVPRAIFGELSADAATQWTGRHNPRPLTESDFMSLYECAFSAGQPTTPVQDACAAVSLGEVNT